MPSTFRISLIAVILAAGCSSEVYLRDGVTDGDTFYLAERALSDDDPVLQSWVSYSLARSACQLQIGGNNPARASSFECELSARRLLLQSWQEKKERMPGVRDEYLDALLQVQRATYLDEYVARYFRKRHWQLPRNLDASGYARWAHRELPGHRPETRIIGSWNFSSKVSADQLDN